MPGSYGDSYGEIVELIRREHAERGSPYLVSVNGGVAAGKSWTAATLRRQLTEPGDLRAEVVGSDGFLYPNAVLDRLGLLARKGFPESYDHRALIDFLTAVRARDPDAAAPRYSHFTYDIVDGEEQRVGQPDILIVEGLGLLGTEGEDKVGGLFDLSVYLDADETHLEAWFLSRFRDLLRVGANNRSSFYSQFAALDDDAVGELARAVWRSVNAVNLHEHIQPARVRARVIVEKGPDHAVKAIAIRR
jgi:type I pantothenate kinase